jgi:two-component system OmpR family sensor kinase
VNHVGEEAIQNQASADAPSRPRSRFSLRARLLGAVAAVALVGLLVADVTTYAALRSFLIVRVDDTLDASHRALVGSVLRRGEVAGPVPSDRGQFAAAAPGAYVQLRDGEGNVLFSQSTRGEFSKGTPRLPRSVAELGSGDRRAAHFTVDSAGDGPQFRVRAERSPDGSLLLVALPLDDVAATLRRLVTVEVIVTGAALLVAAGLGLWLVRVGLRPLRDIETTASNIAGGQLNLRVPPADERTEVGRVGAALNTMLERIEDAFERQAASERRLRRFVADASHELRTPVSATAAYAELFELGARQRPADLERVMLGIRRETARMQALIDDLLLLARLDEGRPLERQPVDLVAVAGEAIEAARAVGPKWPLTMDATEPVEVTGDRLALRQVLDNLLANVRTHTPPGTSASVRVSVDDGTAVVEVRDQGPGLESETAARVFERFYRADPSRSRDRGGSGLGLALVAAIVTAHEGSVHVDSSPGEGATFRVRLPLVRGGGERQPDAAEGRWPQPSGGEDPAGGGSVGGAAGPTRSSTARA